MEQIAVFTLFYIRGKETLKTRYLINSPTFSKVDIAISVFDMGLHL